MIRKTFFKAVAVFLSVSVALGSLVFSAEPAATDTYNTAIFSSDGFQAVKVEDFVDTQENFSNNIPYTEQLYSNGEKDGVSLNFNGGSCERAIFTSCKYNIDGFYYKFGRIEKSDSASELPKFCILASPEASEGQFIILFDTQNGAVSYFNSSVSDTQLLSNEKLMYSNLCDTEFTVGFSVTKEGILTLEILFTDGTQLSAGIPTEYSSSVGKNVNSSYMGISPYDSTNAFSINVIGIKYDSFTRPTSLTLTAPVADGKNELVNGNYDCFPNGMTSVFSGADIGSRHTSANKYNIDGLRLRFNELKKNTGYESSNLQFAVSLTDSRDAIGTVRILLDTDNGTLGYYNADTQAVTLISDSDLKYENISNKEFIIGFDTDIDGSCTVFISVGSSSRLYGKIPSEFFSLLGNIETAYFSVSPANSINYFSVKTTGIYVEEKKDGFYIPDKCDFKNPGGYTENLPQKTNVHNGWEFLGTKLTFNGGDVGKCIVSEEKYNFDGLSIRFNNLTKNEQASGALRFTVLASDEVNTLGKFRVMVDTEEGTLSYYNAETAPVVFLQNDLLKYQILSEESFILSLASHSDGSMKCSVKIGDEDIIYGYIPSAFCNNLSKNVSSSYIMIAPGKAIDGAQYYFSINVTGIKFDEYTVPSGSVMRKIVGAGNTLTNKKNGNFPLGETSTFTNSDTTKRQCSREKYSIDGLTLRFDSLEKDSDTAPYPVMALRLTEDINANSGATLYIDTEKGAVAFDSADNILLTSDVLQYERISNREFKMHFSILEDKCTVTAEVSGYEPILFELPYSLADDELYFAIAAGYGTHSFKVTLSGILNDENYINNSWLLPQYKCDELVSVDSNGTPEWLSSSIIAEVNVSVFGTFYDMIPVLDYCAEVGINTLWIPPVSDKGVNGNGYSNMGMDTIDPYLTGIIDYGEEWRQLTDEEYEAGWQVYAEFIKEAHKRNIRILFDVVTFGALKESPLITEHPDWFKGYSQEATCNDFNWNNSELVEWHINNLVQIAEKTNVDGMRFDSEPMITGYEVNRTLRNALLSKGRKLIYIAEARNNDNTVYDLSEGDIQGPDYISVRHFESVFLKYNIVDSVKSGEWIGAPEAQDIHQSGTFKYYTFQLCCHDSYNYGAQGSRLVMGYETLFSPFVPLWVLGEEMNNGKDGDYTRILYLNTLKTADLREPEKRAYYEDVKKMIEIRRKNSDIFESFSENHKNSNICKVDTKSGTELQAYARYADNKGAVVVPNNTDEEINVTVMPRFYEMELSGYESYTVTNLETDEVLAEGTQEEISDFSVNVSAQDTGIFLITANGIKGEVEEEPVPEEPEDNSDLIEYIPHTPYYFAPDTTDLVDFSTFWDTNVPNAENILENGAHKGIKLTFNGGDVGRRITTDNRYNIDGLSLKLDGLTKNEGSVGNPNITVMLSSTTELDKFRIMINTNDGTLCYYNGTVSPITIAVSELLKYDTLSKSSFTITFNINDDGSVTCTVRIDGNNIISGIIPKSFVEQISGFAGTPLYVAVGPGKAYDSVSYYFSVNLVGIWHNTSEKPQNSLVKNVNSNTLVSTEELYYGNYHKGVQFAFDGCNIGGCQMYSLEYALDGLKLSFDSLKKNVGYEENLLKFSVCIGNSAQSVPRFRVVFDTLNGTISYYSGDNPYGELVTIATANILKYKNLKDQPFDIFFRVLADGNVAVDFILGDKTVTGTIPYDFYQRYITEEKIYFGISTSNRNGYFSLVLSGIEQVNTLNFESDWFLEENLFVPTGCEYRLPVAVNRAGYEFLGWLDSDKNLYSVGTRLLSLTSTDYTASVAYPGDIDLNGEKNAFDIVSLEKHLLGVTENVAATADVNCDNKVNIIDFIRLKKVLP